MRVWTLVVALGSLVPMCAAQTVDEVLRQGFTAEVGDGTLGATAEALEALRVADPDNDDAIAALGIVRFLESGELLFQRTYRHGGFNLPVQASMLVGAGGVGQNVGFNPEPEPIDYKGFRESIEEWIAAVARAEETLAQVGEQEIKVRLPIGLARFDLNGDGEGAEREQLWRLFVAVQRRFAPKQADAEAFEIAFDRGDVAWLRGYCHVCMAVGEFLLAYDLRELFERAGHIIYAENETPFEFLKGDRKSFDFATGVDVTDMIALIHLLNFEIVEPERMATARLHLLETLRLGHEMWRWYDAETDDDREWIPNVTQRDSAMPNALITAEMRSVWLRALTEGEELLEGKRVLRFWRGDGERGINVERFFLEPRRFDLVLWVQGSAALPYLEEGPFTSDGLWRDLQDAFDGGFFEHAFWLN